MRVETVPEVRLRHRVEGPVGVLEVLEDDPRPGEAVRGIAPHVEVPVHRSGLGQTGPLEPGMLVRGVRQDELGDDTQPAAMRLAQEQAEIPQRAVGRMHLPVIGNVIPVVPERRRVERQQPQRRHPQLRQVVELVDEAPEVADAVAVGVVEGADVDLVDDGVLVPTGGCRSERSPLWRAAHNFEIGGRHASAAVDDGSSSCSTTNRWAAKPVGSSSTKLSYPSHWYLAPVRRSCTT